MAKESSNGLEERIARRPDEVAACREIRRRVFVDEQGIPEALDDDGLDAAAAHAIVYDRGRAIATGRLVVTAPGIGVLARIAVLADCRGRAIGQRVIKTLEAEARARGVRSLSLQPHAYLEGFYRRLGYERQEGTTTAGGHTLITMGRSLDP